MAGFEPASETFFKIILQAYPVFLKIKN